MQACAWGCLLNIFFKNISKFYGCLKHRKKPQSKTSKKWLTKWHKQDPKLMTMLHLEMKLRRFRYRIFVGCSSRLFKFSSHQHKRAMKSRKCVEIDTWKKNRFKNIFRFWRSKEKQSLCATKRWHQEEDKRRTRKNLELTICSVVGVIVSRSQPAIYHLFHLRQFFFEIRARMTLVLIMRLLSNFLITAKFFFECRESRWIKLNYRYQTFLCKVETDWQVTIPLRFELSPRPRLISELVINFLCWNSLDWLFVH